VKIKYGTAPVEVSHVALARVYDVMVNTEHRDIGSVAGDIQKKLKGLEIPTGMRINLKGEYSRMNESFGSLGFGLAMAAVLVYLLLVALFRSFQGPFIIMFAVPLGLIGVLTMLFLTHTTLNVQSSMGVIFMVGIVVSNGVLLVDFANKQRQQGAGVHQAITTAAAIRFRPILMTFLATFLDLVPMAIGFGKGSEANVPLARAVVGGLLTSTFLTLIVVPIMYTLLNRDKGEAETNIDEHLAHSDFAASLGFARPTPALVPVTNGRVPIHANGTSHNGPEPWVTGHEPAA
jgi:multidrug efflux pump subunit AcrB